MATPLEVAAAHRKARIAVKKRTIRSARKLWRELDRNDLSGSWKTTGPQLAALVTNAQRDVAEEATPYLDALLAAQQVTPDPAGAVAPDALAGTASDGRGLLPLLFRPVITTKTAIGRGTTVSRAAALGEYQLMRIVGTQVNDAGRVADSVAAVTDREVGGYVRMLEPPSCSRCVILAGKWFRWNQGFRRHPLCDCVHLPARETDADDLRVDPDKYFDSLPKDEQDQAFTKDGAQAIRDGADIGQVVNARRGMETAQVYRKDTLITREGITRHGIAGRARAKRGVSATQAPRLMPETIYRAATGRDDAIRLLRVHGFITD